MKTNDITPEFGYLVDQRNKRINLINKTGYAKLIENLLYTEKRNYLWREYSWRDFVFTFSQGNSTSLSELNLSQKEEVDLYQLIKSNHLDQDLVNDSKILVSVDQANFTLIPPYSSKFKAAIAINEKYQFGLYFCQYSWELMTFDVHGDEDLKKALNTFLVKNDLVDHSILIQLENGSVEETSSSKFCKNVEETLGKKLFEALTFEEVLQNRFHVSSMYQLKNSSHVSPQQVQLYQNIFNKMASDYSAAMFFCLNQNAETMQIKPDLLQNWRKNHLNWRLQLAVEIANLHIPRYFKSKAIFV